MTRPLAHVLVPLLLVLSSGLAALGPTAQDSLARLRTWLDHSRGGSRRLDPAREAELRAILGELRLQRPGAGEGRAMDRALLELACLGWSPGEERAVPAEGRARTSLDVLARLGRAELESALDDDGAEVFALWLVTEVLEGENRRPLAERVLAAELLAGRFLPATRQVLQRCAREPDDDLARAAESALAGWPDPAVHVFFLEQLSRGAGSMRAIAAHFERARESLEPLVLDRLCSELARLYLCEDWRAAARARALVRALDPARAVPVLIEALATWERRGREGRGSRRILFEISGELQRISGRTLGTKSERWSSWWEAVRSGRIALPEEILAAGGQTSSAAFFGLHAVSDRVAFVVDRSGSMGSSFGTGARTRYEEAIVQLTRFLEQSGEDTRFTVALFGDEGLAWRPRLTEADPEHLRGVQNWLSSKSPQGETLLFQGLCSALDLDARGRLRADKLQADTVIVLCDGATTEGPGWVVPWLAANNEQAQVVFHCVQIGAEGNGTLEALASGSGGQFVRVKG